MNQRSKIHLTRVSILQKHSRKDSSRTVSGHTSILTTPYSPFFFFSSTTSTLSAGIPFRTPTPPSIISTISSLTSPCTTISSRPCGFLVTEEPVANLEENCLEAFFRSMPNASRPWIEVTCLRLFRSILFIVIYLEGLNKHCADAGDVECNVPVKPSSFSVQHLPLPLPLPPSSQCLSRASFALQDLVFLLLLGVPL